MGVPPPHPLGSFAYFVKYDVDEKLQEKKWLLNGCSRKFTAINYAHLVRARFWKKNNNNINNTKLKEWKEVKQHLSSYLFGTGKSWPFTLHSSQPFWGQEKDLFSLLELQPPLNIPQSATTHIHVLLLQHLRKYGAIRAQSPMQMSLWLIMQMGTKKLWRKSMKGTIARGNSRNILWSMISLEAYCYTLRGTNYMFSGL